MYYITYMVHYYLVDCDNEGVVLAEGTFDEYYSLLALKEDMPWALSKICNDAQIPIGEKMYVEYTIYDCDGEYVDWDESDEPYVYEGYKERIACNGNAGGLENE